MLMACTGGGILVPIFINAIPVPLAQDAYPVAILISFLLHSYFPILREVVDLSPVFRVSDDPKTVTKMTKHKRLSFLFHRLRLIFIHCIVPSPSPLTPLPICTCRLDWSSSLKRCVPLW